MKIDLAQILEFYNNLNEQTRYAILGVVVFIVILLDVFFVALPQWASIADINRQITKLTEDTKQVLVDRQRLKQIRKNLEEARLQLNALSDKVRPVQEVPSILETISSVANDFGVKIDQLAPDKEHQVLLKKAPDGNYYALPVVIKASCGYHMFGRFLNKLENQNMFFLIKDFIIQNNDKDVNTHLFSLTIKIILVDRSPALFKKL